MNRESQIGLGLAALLALCCAGPLVLSLLFSAGVLAALGALRAEDRLLLVGSGAVLIVVAAWLVTRRTRSTLDH
jgi:cytochrome c biogenesis protein CcdA